MQADIPSEADQRADPHAPAHCPVINYYSCSLLTDDAVGCISSMFFFCCFVRCTMQCKHKHTCKYRWLNCGKSYFFVWIFMRNTLQTYKVHVKWYHAEIWCCFYLLDCIKEFRQNIVMQNDYFVCVTKLRFLRQESSHTVAPNVKNVTGGAILGKIYFVWRKTRKFHKTSACMAKKHFSKLGEGKPWCPIPVWRLCWYIFNCLHPWNAN